MLHFLDPQIDQQTDFFLYNYPFSFYFLRLYFACNVCSSLTKRSSYKVCACGLSVTDWFITMGLLLFLYALVSAVFTAMMLWLQAEQKTTLNNDYALWICFTFGLAYWIIVTIMVATGERVQFDSALAEEDLLARDQKQSDA